MKVDGIWKRRVELNEDRNENEQGKWKRGNLLHNFYSIHLNDYISHLLSNVNRNYCKNLAVYITPVRDDVSNLQI